MNAGINLMTGAVIGIVFGCFYLIVAALESAYGSCAQKLSTSVRDAGITAGCVFLLLTLVLTIAGR